MTSTHPPSPVDPARLERNWRAITIELDHPRPSWPERLLRRLGFGAHLTRLVVSTPTLRRSWFGALALVVIVGLSATDADRPIEDLFILLLLAPLVPVLGVSMAYGVQADPAHEASLATPMSGFRLLCTRALVVLVCSTLVLGIAALLTPAVPAMAFAWLLPAVGLTAASLAAMTFTSPRRAAAAVTIGWVLIVVLARAGADDPLAAFGVAGQATLGLVAALGSSIAYWRRSQFDVLQASMMGRS